MITRIWFGTVDVPWKRAPGDAAPVRVARSVAMPELEADPPWEQLTTAAFRDADHLARFDEWSGGAAGPTLAAEQVVVRGADWLDRRWADRGARLKHVALARRAPGLSPAELTTRWRAHAGSVGSTAIPDAARGQAYAQSHPIDADPLYDAVTEVWFDDEADLRARIAWMAEALATAPPDELFGDRRLFAVREELL